MRLLRRGAWFLNVFRGFRTAWCVLIGVHVQYLGDIGYSDSLPIHDFLPAKEGSQQEEGWVLSSEEVGAFHKSVEAYLTARPDVYNGGLFVLYSDMDDLLKAALWEDKFDEIWSKDAPSGISFSSEEERDKVVADIPRLLAGAEPSNKYSESFCEELERWCEAYFQLYCGNDYKSRNYPQWFTLRYRRE